PVAPDVAHHLASTRRVADEHDIVQVELLDERGEVIGECVHVVAVPRLVGAAVAAPVVGDASVAAGCEEEHLFVPGIRVQRPAVAEDHRLAGAPILVVDVCAILRTYRAHRVALPFRWWAPPVGCASRSGTGVSGAIRRRLRAGQGARRGLGARTARGTRRGVTAAAEPTGRPGRGD